MLCDDILCQIFNENRYICTIFTKSKPVNSKENIKQFSLYQVGTLVACPFTLSEEFLIESLITFLEFSKMDTLL